MLKQILYIAIGVSTLVCILFLIFLLGATRADQKGGDMVCSIDGDGFLICASVDGNDSIVKEYELSSGRILNEYRVFGKRIIGIVAGFGSKYFSIRATTPLGRSTVQSYIQSQSDKTKLIPCLPADESFRIGIMLIDGKLTYLKSTRYGGAWTGWPWMKPYHIYQLEGAKERFIGEAMSLHSYASVAGQTTEYYLYPQRVLKNYNIIRVSTKSSKEMAIPVNGWVDCATQSLDGRQLAWIEVSRGIDQVLNVLDLKTGKIKLTLPLKQRASEAVFDSNGALYLVKLADDSDSLSIAKIDGKSDPVFESFD